MGKVVLVLFSQQNNERSRLKDMQDDLASIKQDIAAIKQKDRQAKVRESSYEFI